MSESVLKSVSPARSLRPSSDWGPGPEEVIVGKDVLELISTSMYVDPMTIYREYVQNAADAIEERRKKATRGSNGKVSIDLDSVARSITIRDSGIGLEWELFCERLCTLGASVKRGTSARGFRGVGRLAGLGYCQELIFRSRAEGEDRVAELRWDGRRLKSALRASHNDGDLADLVREVVSVRRVPAGSYPAHFFEVELTGVIRHRNDRLLNPEAVSEYLAQVAPVPFSPQFRFGSDISAALRSHVDLGELDIRVNQSEEPLYRPHSNRIQIGEGEFDKYVDIEFREFPGVDGGVAGVAWVLHHGYTGAIPSAALVKGLRLRTGNMQIGDHALLEELFPEQRFNGWAVGEIHIVDRRITPNGRRDHFEQSVHFDNLLNHAGPIARDIARRCRQSSISRKWLREFQLQKSAAIERAEIASQGGMRKTARETHAQASAKALAAMKKIAGQRHLAEDTRSELSKQVTATEARVSKLLGKEPKAADVLARYKPQLRAAYEQVLGLIYECASNRAAAKALVEKILGKLEVTAAGPPKRSSRPKKPSKRR
jgi:Histidine kinase-, DNA gyrase B-, and HSP90-like ATPase